MTIPGFAHKVRIHEKDVDRFVEHLEWCIEHCKGQFKDVNLYNDRVWYFEDEKDAMLFALQWSEEQS